MISRTENETEDWSGHHTYIDFLPLADVSHQSRESQQANEAEQLGKSEYPEGSTCQNIQRSLWFNKLICSELSPGGQNDLLLKIKIP